MKLKFRTKLTSKELKQQSVEALKKELAEAKSLILFSSLKVTHKNFEEFRQKLAEVNAKLRFVKNTLFKVAAKELKFPEALYQSETLAGPTSLIYVLSDDFITVIKAFSDHFVGQEQVKVKIAFLDKEIFNSVKVMEFSQIPSVKELQVKLVYAINNPVQKFYNHLIDQIAKLVRSLNCVAKGMSQ